MICKYPNCPVKYKSRIPFDPKPTDIIKIYMRLDHIHVLEDIKKIVCHGIKKKVKPLIEPLVLNKVKPRKILNILKEYVKQNCR